MTKITTDLSKEELLEALQPKRHLYELNDLFEVADNDLQYHCIDERIWVSPSIEQKFIKNEQENITRST